MKYSLYLGKIVGVKIYVHWTFLILIGWIVISNMKAGLSATQIMWTVGLVMAVFGCIVFHELGHAVAARRYKVQTKFITLLPIGGVAQLESIPRKPKQELVIALAGPAVNFIIALILVPFVNLKELLQTETIVTLGPSNFLFFLISINIWLALFNLIPAFPMDGGRVFRALLGFWFDYTKATKIAAGVGQVFGIAFVFLGFIYSPTLIFIGLFVFLSGKVESSLVQTTDFLHKYTVQDVLMKEIPMLENNSSVKDAVNALLNSQNKNFVVTDHGEPVGTIKRDEIINAMKENGEATLLDAVKNKNLAYVPESMPLDEAWKLMQTAKNSLMLVGSSDHLSGMVEEENIAEFILIRSALHEK